MKWVFHFGYETPGQAAWNAAHGTDDESTEAVVIEAPDEGAAMAWGQEIAEQFVRRLGGTSWQEASFACWIEPVGSCPWATHQPVIAIGQMPDFDAWTWVPDTIVHEPRRGRPEIAWLIAALALAGLPMALAAACWLGGELPDRATWFSDHNHGPWREDMTGGLLAMTSAILGLPIVAGGSFVHGIVDAIRRRRVARVMPFLAVSILAMGLEALVLTRMFWLVD